MSEKAIKNLFVELRPLWPVSMPYQGSRSVTPLILNGRPRLCSRGLPPRPRQEAGGMGRGPFLLARGLVDPLCLVLTSSIFHSGRAECVC